MFRALLPCAALLCLLTTRAGAQISQCAGTLCVTSTTSLAVGHTIGDPNPPPIPLSVTSTAAPLTFNVAVASITPMGVNWIAINPRMGTTPRLINLTIDPQLLSPRGATTYSAVIRFTSPVNPANDVFVTLMVSGTASVTAVPNTLGFIHTLGAPPPAPKTVSVESVATPAWPLRFTTAVRTTTGGRWLSISPAAGMTTQAVSVSVSPAMLVEGSYGGVIELADTAGAYVPPNLIPVSLMVVPGLNADPGTLFFTYPEGGPGPPAQSINLGSTGSALNFTASASSSGNWLSLPTASGSTSTTLTLSINAAAASLSRGTHLGQVGITAAKAGNSPLAIPVTLSVTAPALAAAPAALDFSYALGGPVPVPATLAISSGSKSIPFAVAVAGAPWLSVNPSTGTTAGSLQVSVNPAGLAAGHYITTVRISSAEAANALTIPVTLVVAASVNAPVEANASSLTFSGQPGGPAAASQRLMLTATGPNVPFTLAVASSGGWLSVAPPGGTTPVTVMVNARPGSLGAGGYVGTITILVAGSPPIAIPAFLKVGTIPEVDPGGAVNAASSAAAFARGALGTLYGRNLATTTALNEILPVPATLAGVSILVNDIAARPFFVSPGQINFQLPVEGPPGRVELIVIVNGVRSLPVPIILMPAAPGIFLLPNTTHAVAHNQDYSLNEAGNPVPPGGVLIAYFTGQGDVEPEVPTGEAAPADPLARPKLPVSATIAGRPVRVAYAGLVAGLVGLLQVNLEIEGVPPGEQPLVVTIGGAVSNSATVSIGR